MHGLGPVLVVPPKRRKSSRLAQSRGAAVRVGHHRVGRVVYPLPRVLARLGGAAAGPLGARVGSPPVGGRCHQPQRQLPHQHRGRLQVDALVLEGHEQGPGGVGRAGGGGVQPRLAGDEAGHQGVYLATVRRHLGNGGPVHVVLAQIVPGHFVDARLEDGLQVVVQPAAQEARHPQLVHVQHRRVGVVEDERVPQVVVRWAVEGLLACAGRAACRWRDKERAGRAAPVRHPCRRGHAPWRAEKSTSVSVQVLLK